MADPSEGQRGWSPDQMAARLAADLEDGMFVNLGIGLPTLVSNWIPADREVIFHSENGILGVGPRAEPGNEDPDLVNAGKQPVTLLPGGCFFSQAESFAMIRGRHVDAAVLGAYQVSARGDLANWRVPTSEMGSIGGAMDLAVGARRVFVLMEHTSRDGASKLVEECTYPLTGVHSVDRVYTNLGVIEVGPEGLELIDLAPGVDVEEVQARTAAPVRVRLPAAGRRS